MGIDAISISGDRFKWEGLARKLRAGKPLDVAAEELGIDYEEAAKLLTSKLDATIAAADLRTIKQAHKASAKAFRLLSAIAEEGAVYTGSRESVQFPNLQAAKALLDYSIKAQRLIKAGKIKRDKEGDQPDLFDLAETKGPWDLRETEDGRD